MRITLVKSATTRFSGINIEHKNKVLEFGGDGTIKGGDNTHDLFNCFHEYVQMLDDSKVDKLFELYGSALLILNPTHNPEIKAPDEYLIKNRDYNFLIDRLKPIVNEIIELINPTKLYYFISQSPEYLETPPNLEYARNKGDYPMEMTIDSEEYKELVKLVLLLRPLYPIINALIKHLEDQKITKDYKEVIAGKLISDNPHLVESRGWNKMISYINYTFKTKGIGNQKVEIITEDKYTAHAIYKTLFTRFLVFLIPSQIKERNLAKFLWSGVRQFEDGGSIIRDKKGIKDEAGDKRSVMELYQLQEDIKSSDEIAECEFFSFGLYDEDDNPRTKDRFKHQCNALGIKNPKLVDSCFDIIPNAWDFELRQHAVILCQLVFIDNVSYQITNSLEYEQLLCYMALAQVKLFEMGYPNLAVIVTATYNPSIPRHDSAKFTSLDLGERALVESICDVHVGKGDSEGQNEAVLACNEFLREFYSKGWESTIELGMLNDKNSMTTAAKGHLYEVDLNKDIKEEFIRLVLEVNNID